MSAEKDREPISTMLPQAVMPAGGVFLSYASEDAAAAERLAAALRAAGIEVWIDKSELRGGDAWDRKIRQQIKACPLFIPIISGHTHERSEGYFRLEWKLAVDRSHLMTANRAFLMPVVIDDTREDDEEVPDKFRELQWTRLPGGETPPEFVERVRKLLSPEPSATRAAASAVPPGSAAELIPTKSVDWQDRSKIAVWAIGAVLTAGLAYLLLDKLWLSKRVTTQQPMRAASAAPTVTPATIAIPDKSVAVLPFLDMSEKKDQEYFSDGLSEELIDMLSKVPELRVPARTSSFYFKGKQATVPEIAKALGVADVLEGSVRKSGNKVRVTAQLVSAENGYHLWSETYDRQLDDIFKVQDEIAVAVVKALQVSLMGGSLPTSTGTQNIQAYNLYLQGRSMYRHANERADYERVIEYLRSAVDTDPKFADAWALLSRALRKEALSNTPLRVSDGVLDQKLVEEARRAAKQALKLNGALSGPHLAYAGILGDVDFDIRGAAAQVQQALELDPNSPDVLNFAALMPMYMGQLDRAVEFAQKSIAIDPVNPGVYYYLALIYSYAGKYPEALAANRKMLDLDPGSHTDYHELAAWVLLAEGNPAAALTEIDSEKQVRERCSCVVLAYDALGRKGEADAAMANLETHHADDNACDIGLVYANRGKIDRAFGWFERAYRQRDWNLFYLKVSPLTKNVRSDPRFRTLLGKLGLLD